MKLSKPLRIIRNLLLFFFISTTVTVVVYSFMPVYVTPLMIIRSVQQVFKGEKPRRHHEWVPFDKLSPHLPMAVIASEDNRFATHNGFDFIEIQKAMKENEKAQAETRCEHHQPADGKERISVAAVLMDSQGL